MKLDLGKWYSILVLNTFTKRYEVLLEGIIMYIAHKRKADEVEQSVKDHCCGVARLSEEWGGKIGMAACCRICAKLHDMGKESDVFLEYILYSYANPLDDSKRGTVDHAQAGGKYVFENFYDNADIIGKITAEVIAMVVCFHHGGLSDYVSLDCKSPFLNRVRKVDEENIYEQIKENYLRDCYSVEELEKDFSEAKDEVEAYLKKCKDLKLNKFGISLITKYIYSCIIDGDRFDTYLFMENQKENFLDTKKLWVELSNKMESFVASLLCKNDIDILRGQISDACKNFAVKNTGIYSLTVPTGGGKTYSSFRYALEHAKEDHKDRIIYIAPFTTIIDQNAKQIKNILKCDPLILEHHSNVIRDNDREEFKLMTERWDSPIIFTTMVQFLNTLFEGGTQSVRRMHHLANAVLIFDEIQTIPISCIHLFDQAINFLNKICNTTCILCTATQPALSETKRPIILSDDGEMIPDLTKTFQKFKRVKVVDKQILGGYSFAELATLIFEKGGNVESILTICNTKKTVETLFAELSEKNRELPEHEQFVIFHLSTNMCPAHRLDILEVLYKALDESKKGGKRIICISTQLIEAGIDISFACVFREVAGLDSIAQAAGRCNRHGEVALREAYIFNLTHENLSMLPQMKEGAECTKRLLNEFKENPRLFDEDLLSPKSMEQYYRGYYTRLKEKMDFPIGKGETSVYALLDQNKWGTDAYGHKYGKNIELILHQAYKTAGKEFKVIPDNTIAVLAPYGEGIKLIEKLNGTCNLTEITGLLKKAQHYCVNLYYQNMGSLNENSGIYDLANGGVLALKPEFYDEKVGVLFKGRPMEFMNA